MVHAAGCDSFCTGSDGSSLLTGEYIGLARAPVDEEPPVSLESEPQPSVSTEPPVKVEIFHDERGMSWVRVVSVVDRVTVQDVRLNRGGCDVNPGAGQVKNDRVLQFGMNYDHPLFCPSLLEIEVTTDVGVWTFAVN